MARKRGLRADYPARLSTIGQSGNIDEADQIRLSLAAEHDRLRVDAVGWNQDPPGKDDNYDFLVRLKAKGRSAEWVAFQKIGQSQADALRAPFQLPADRRRGPQHNDEAGSAEFVQPYCQIATFVDSNRNAGAA